MPASAAPDVYYRPLAQFDAHRSRAALPIAGGWCWFDQVQRLERGQPAQVVAVSEVPAEICDAISGARPAVAGLALNSPRLMGILNVTPDSFSDGGQFDAPDVAVAHARAMVERGADIIDIGGESTRPGADFVSATVETERTVPVIAAIRKATSTPISIDTRKAEVARAALAAGAQLVNDVSALTYDAQLAEITAKSGVPICLMHAQGDPDSMQDAPRYDDVLLDVYDYLNARIAAAVAAGIARDRIIVDPGIGFGKTLDHNLALLRGLSLFHGLGCPILLGASRKRFIGTIAGAADARARVPGSIAVALAGVAQGVQITRVHDIDETRQALDLWAATTGMGQKL